MVQYVIVSRHPAAIEFIRRHKPEFADAPVVASADVNDVKGKVIAGNVPLSLAAHAASIFAVEFSGDSPRGVEYDVSDMQAAGACMKEYKVLSASQVAALAEAAHQDGAQFMGEAIWGA